MKTHYFYLSAFRLAAAFMILLGHARCELFATYSELNVESQNIFTQLFFVGVGWSSEALAIFFVMSGFLVGGPLLQRLHNAICGDKSEQDCKAQLKRFTIGRLVRIFVPLFFATFLAAVVKMIGHDSFSWLDALLNVFGLQGVLASDFGGVYWTLAYEIWFYILLSAILMLYCGRKWMLCGTILLLLSSFVIVNLSSCWFFMMLLGIGLYFMKDLDFPRYMMWLSIAGIIIVKILGVLAVESHVFQFALHGKINFSMTYMVLALCFGIIMTMLAKSKPEEKLSIWIENFGNKWCGFTYCLYITHFTVLELFRYLFGKMPDVNLQTFGIYIFMCGFCILFAYLFYWVIEHRLGSYIKKKLG